MKEKQMEKYIWMYLDGQMSPEETEVFLQNLQINDKLREELEMASKLDSLLKAQPDFLMSDHLRSKITAHAILNQVRPEKSTNWWTGKDLKWFILMNLAILLLGLFFSWKYSSGSGSSYDPINWSLFFEVLNKPYLRLFFLLCAGTFTLLVMDYFLKAKWSTRYNYVG